jgi:hypothetical protein
VKSEEDSLPDDHGTWGRLFIPGISSLPIWPKLMIPLQAPLIALQAAMPTKDMATSTGAFGFLRCACPLVSASLNPFLTLHVRTMGGTVGIAVGQAIYTSILKKKINRIPELSGFDTSAAALSESVRTLKTLPVGDETSL